MHTCFAKKKYIAYLKPRLEHHKQNYLLLPLEQPFRMRSNTCILPVTLNASRHLGPTKFCICTTYQLGSESSAPAVVTRADEHVLLSNLFPCGGVHQYIAISRPHAHTRARHGIQRTTPPTSSALAASC
jgi:hypothetical protein